MKRFVTLCIICLNCINTAALTAEPEDWDLVKTYNASTHVFYGEVIKILPEPDFKTGVMGVRLRDIDDGGLPKEELIWRNAKELSFSMDEAFKQRMPTRFVAYLPDPNLSVWTHVMNEVGDEFLAKPESPDAQLLKLIPGDRGLFFARYYTGSTIPVLYKVRLGKLAESDLALLRAQAAGNVPLELIVQQARAQEAAAAAREAEAVRAFEDDYYKILRIQELEIRRSLLNDLVERMGFEGLWTYFEFKERYLKEHGAHVPDSEVPSGPTEGKEKLWHDISGELKKIDAILKARTR